MRSALRELKHESRVGTMEVGRGRVRLGTVFSK